MRFSWTLIRRFAAGSAFAVTGVYGSTLLLFQNKTERNFEKVLSVARAQVSDLNKRSEEPLPSRGELLERLRKDQEYDVLVIGGGATGAGVALDSQSRGLKTCLIEQSDFSSGTSSKSTKLIHGGVRYLQNAIMRLDFEQYRMVKEALFERANLLKIAPHLSAPLPIMLPIYKWWQVPYFWFGIKAYDFVSGKRILKSSYFIRKSKALELFPMLKKEKLCGALIYYDGQHDDARMNLAIVLSAIRLGGDCVNHTQVVKLLKNKRGKLCGATVRDNLTGNEWDVRAKCIVNATGPFTDGIRLMDNPNQEKICVPSQGVHVVLPGYYCPANVGLLDPQTSDGRVIFFLPWEKGTVAGTTDSPCDVTQTPAPADTDIEFILEELRHYLSNEITVRRGDVLSAWAGLRPLVRDPSKKDTASIARNHIIDVSDSNLITIAGGKWTTYRHMAEETVDKAIEVCNLQPKRGCVTPGLMLEGAHDWHPLLHIRLVQDYGLEEEVAKHLARAYGDRAFSVAKMARLTGKRWPILGTRIHEEFPYIESEVEYACREYACTVVDVLARRIRLAFLNTYAAEEALPVIVRIMAHELDWDLKEIEAQTEAGKEFIAREMGKLARKRALEESPVHLSSKEIRNAHKNFNLLDKTKKGYITLNDIRRFFNEKGEKLDENQLHELLNEIDLNKNGQIGLMEFLQLYSGLKGGRIASNRLVNYLEADRKAAKKITVTRSGGGV